MRSRLKVCTIPGCPELTTGTRCDRHEQERRREEDARRPSSAGRGYGIAHQRLRKKWTPKVALGVVKCARCGELIRPGDAWDLGHDDTDRSRYTGPEHAACNRATRSRR